MCQDCETNEKIIVDKNIDLNERIRSMFCLRNINHDSAAIALTKALYDESELLAHEAAYCLGQMKRTCVIPQLTKILSDKKLPVVVRHEAAEAIAAINDENSAEILRQFQTDSDIEVAETCQIGYQRIQHYQRLEKDTPNTLYGSVDPAPPHPSIDVNFLSNLLIDSNESLFDRYRAMFALRDIGSDICVESLLRGFCCKSSLFKHEIGFVLGQIRKESAVDALIKVVDNECEHPMVRHECAEALGNIGTNKCTYYLHTRINDKDRIVRESCLVALDIAVYQNSDNFQYVNTVSS